MKFCMLPNHTVLILIFVLFSSLMGAEAKRTVAVLDFEGLGISEDQTKGLTNRLRGLLVETGDYRVIERGKMQDILDEQGFQLSGCTSEGCLVEVGQLLGVQLMLAGSITRINDKFYSVDMRLINIETGAIENTATHDEEGTVDKLMREALYKLLGREIKKKNTWKWVAAAVVAVGSAVIVMLIQSQAGADSGLPMPPNPPSAN